MNPRRRHDLLAVALLALLPSLLFIDVLAGRANFVMRDLTRYYYPTKQIYRRIVEQGEFPMWNRFFHGGQPLAANPEHEIFYPPTWLLFLPDFDLGYRLHILIHVYIALFGMYALLRSMQNRPAAACFGAVSWGLGGLLLSCISLLPFLFSVAWLPLTALFTRRFLIDRRPRDFALASLAFGVQCLVAEPTTLLQTGLLLGAYAIYRGMKAKSPLNAVVRNIAWVGGISAAAAFAGSVQLLPAADLLRESARARGLPFELVSAWSTPWAKLAELVYPNILGHAHLAHHSYWAGRLYEPMGAPFLFSIYPGLAVAALAIAGVVCRVRGSRFAMLLAAASVIAAAGSHLPFLRFAYDAGILTSFRYPEKFLLVAVFALTVLAAKSCDRLLRGDADIRNVTAAFALATAVVAAGIVALGFTPWSLAAWTSFFGLPSDPETFRLIGIAWNGWTIAAARGLLLCLIVISVRFLPRRLWLVFALLFVCADLGPVVHQVNPRMPARFFTPPPAVAAVAAAGDSYRLFHLADWEQGERVARLYDDPDARYWVIRNGMFPMIPAAYAIQTVLEHDYDETSLLPTGDFTRSMWDVRRSGRPDWLPPFLAMSNARFVAVSRNPAAIRASNYEEASPVEFIETKAYPRYYFADQVVAISGRDDFVRKLSQERHSERVAFIEGLSFRPARGRVTKVQETANTATIDVEAEGEAFLVMSVTPHKYWRITVDGAPVRPLVANVGYQGVAVPKGRHRVAMTYRNDLIPIGGAITLASLGVLAFLASRRRTLDA
ncbi:MAG TPA: YfhO family protein [Thermoanaerobaculia bacterium]|nr:YfhO family protein [Thermoanaerobaculia bacterium]